MADSAQKFIARNRAPRVQIEYDVELYGAEKKVQLPFVMGVMSDLSGKSEVAQPPLEDRKFLEIDVDNFDARMKGVAPRVAFTVPNTLSGEGNLQVDLTFERMADFEPGAIAARVAPLRPLLEARQQLSTLMAYMDGKAGAEALIERILADPALLKSLAAAEGPTVSGETVLEGLRALAPEETAAKDEQGEALAALRAAAPEEVVVVDEQGDALDALRAVEVREEAVEDGSAALEGLRAAAPEEAEPEDAQGEALDALRAVEVTEEEAEEDQGSALEALKAAGPAEPPEPTGPDAEEILSGLEAPEEAPDETPDATDILAGLEAPEEQPDQDDREAILGSLEAPDVVREEADQEAILSGLDAPEAPTPDEEDASTILAGLETPEESAEEEEDLDAILSDIEAPVDIDTDEGDADSVLAGLDAPEEDEKGDDLDAVLDGLEAPDAPEEGEDRDAILSGLETPEEEEEVEALLEGIDPGTVPTELESAAEIGLGETAPAPAGEGPGTEEPAGDLEDAEDLDALLADLEETPEEAVSDAFEEEDDIEALMADLEETPDEAEGDGDLDALLSDLDEQETDAAAPEEAAEDDLDSLLADLDEEEAPEAAATESDADLDALLSDLEEESDEIQAVAPAEETDEDEAMAPEQDDDLDALLADLEEEAPDETVSAPPDSDDDLEALLSDLEEETDEDQATAPEQDDDLDALLADLEEEAPDNATAEPSDSDDDLDALMASLEEEITDEPSEDAPGEEDLDALLTDLDEETPTATAPDTPTEPAFAYGTMSAERPAPERLKRQRFRLALLGDFTGRAARGALEVGDALAARPPILLDPDTVEEVIEGFATTLVLPIGREGAGVEVRLAELEDLHPDSLYEKVPLFGALRDLKGQLRAGATAEHAAKTLRAWGEAHGRPVKPPRALSGGNSVRPDLKLSDFQRLVGDREGALSQPSPVEDLLARIVGPHIRRLPDADAQAMEQAVDAALSGAMRLVLHHPEFQAVESQWRALDLIARRIETDDSLDVVLYDISAEEIAADLTQADELSQSGFLRLLTEGPLDEENGRGGFSALLGFYSFEETPPHAQLLGRIARLAAHVDAPFFAAITPHFIETEKADRHPLVAQEWDRLRAMPEAGHLALVTPRFLLRRPYGARSEPIYEFDFEEFTPEEGLSGMLWANPVTLVAILLAQSFKQNGPAMELGKIMSIGDMPYHFVNDRYGDQVALPCTERNLLLPKVERVLGRGFMPVVSVKGRDEVRLASFQALGAAEVLGPWTGVEPPPASPPKPPKAAPEEEAAAEEEDEDLALGGEDLDDLLADFETDDDDEDEDLDLDLEDDGMDAELAALLEDL
jgi:type VI secretion system ImpB/VipA family protein